MIIPSIWKNKKGFQTPTFAVHFCSLRKFQTTIQILEFGQKMAQDFAGIPQGWTCPGIDVVKKWVAASAVAAVNVWI